LAEAGVEQATNLLARVVRKALTRGIAPGNDVSPDHGLIPGVIGEAELLHALLHGAALLIPLANSPPVDRW
jgi:hypothetical protein